MFQSSTTPEVFRERLDWNVRTGRQEDLKGEEVVEGNSRSLMVLSEVGSEVVYVTGG